jgi:hypothetical protein
VCLFFVGQLLLSLGVFYVGLLLLEGQAHPENYFEDFLARRRRRNCLRYSLELIITHR